MPLPPDAACITIRGCAGALSQVHDWLQDFMRDQSFGTKLCHDLTLITEELLMNSVRHGVVKAKQVTIHVWLDGAEVWLEFQDQGAAFNPLDVATPDLSADLTTRRIGGLGIHLIKQLADHVCYRYQDGVNYLRIGKALRRE